MDILAHRGLWYSEEDRNSVFSIKEAFSRGFGCEIDLRDYNQTIVISHDMGNKASPLFDKILGEWDRYPNCTLALDIKACGIINDLKPKISNRPNYFCFGMTVPEMLEYSTAGVSFYTRQSEYEETPILYDLASGVWIDYFNDDEASVKRVPEHIRNGKGVCVVSAELNGRDPSLQWELLRHLGPQYLEKIMLCTDKPMEAEQFFKGRCWL